MKKPFHFSTIFKRFHSFDLGKRNSSNSFYISASYLQIKVWAADGRIICRSKFNLPIQDLCADHSSIFRWKNFLQIKEPYLQIKEWFATGLQLTFNCSWLICNCNLQLTSALVELATTHRLTWHISRLLSNYGRPFSVSMFPFIGPPPFAHP